MSEKIKASKILYELQEAGRIQMENDKPSVDDLLDRNLALMVNRIDMVISREVTDDEEITYTSNACPSERATLLRVYSAKAGEEQVAYASSIWSLVNFKTRRIMKAKELNMKNFTLARYRNPFGDRKFRITEEDENAMEDMGTFKVGREYMDDNGHMNNIKYLEHVEACIPELESGSFMKEIRLHFMKEALYDEELRIKRLRKEDAYYFRMYKPDGEANFECEIVIS
jgi:acyl-ACP thioesterase